MSKKVATVAISKSEVSEDVKIKTPFKQQQKQDALALAELTYKIFKETISSNGGKSNA